MTIHSIPGSETVPLERIADVERLRIELRERVEQGGCVYLDYQPGNGTRYAMCVQKMDDARSLGREHPYAGSWLVSLLDFRTCMLISQDGTAAPEYIQQKLGIGGPDAAALAFLFAQPPEGR
jgi:hypothetical protein